LADTIYWTSFVDSAIRGAPLAGGNVDTLYDLTHGALGPRGVAIDSAGGRICWANQGDESIRGAPLAGGMVDQLYGPGRVVDIAGGIAIDSAAGRIYWTNEIDDMIREAPLAGHGIADILYPAAQAVSSPEGLVIDPAAGRIYWTNDGDNTIRGAPLSGNGIVDTLYGGSGQGVNGPLFLAVLRAPLGAGAPTISGAGRLGQPLACSRGAWAADVLGCFLYRAPQSFTYQWTLDGSNVGGATLAGYTPATPGSYTCQVTAINRAGSTAQTSSAVAVS
jgi:hypothetical protein